MINYQFHTSLKKVIAKELVIKSTGQADQGLVVTRLVTKGPRPLHNKVLLSIQFSFQRRMTTVCIFRLMFQIFKLHIWPMKFLPGPFYRVISDK
jgi:hypothetical protein